MKSLHSFLEVHEPKAGAEKNFKKKHITIKHDDPNGNKDDVFNATNVKKLDRKTDRHGYNAGEDERVYEATKGQTVYMGRYQDKQGVPHALWHKGNFNFELTQLKQDTKSGRLPSVKKWKESEYGTVHNELVKGGFKWDQNSFDESKEFDASLIVEKDTHIFQRGDGNNKKYLIVGKDGARGYDMYHRPIKFSDELHTKLKSGHKGGHKELLKTLRDHTKDKTWHHVTAKEEVEMKSLSKFVKSITEEQVEVVDESMNDRAPQNYKHHTKEAKHHLAKIGELLDAHVAKAGDKVHWGHVGDMNHVHSRLKELHDMLSYTQPKVHAEEMEISDYMIEDYVDTLDESALDSIEGMSDEQLTEEIIKSLDVLSKE